MTSSQIDSAPALVAQSLRPRFGPAKWLSYAVGILSLIFAAGVLFEVLYRRATGLDPFVTSDPTLSMVILVFLSVSLLMVVAFIASVIFVAMWTYRAMKNLHIAGARHAEMSAGWAVGWHFIPIANLWKPLEGMMQIWRGSKELAGRPIKLPSRMGWWWATWLISNTLSNVSLRLGGWDGTGAGYDTALWLDFAASLLQAVCAFLLVSIMREVTEDQDAMQGGHLSDTFS